MSSIENNTSCQANKKSLSLDCQIKIIPFEKNGLGISFCSYRAQQTSDLWDANTNWTEYSKNIILLWGRTTSNSVLIHIKEWFEPLDQKDGSKEVSYNTADTCSEHFSKHIPFFHIGGYDSDHEWRDMEKNGVLQWHLHFPNVLWEVSWNFC